MPRFFQNSLVCLIILMPFAASAMSKLYDSDAVVTMRNGQPCFSYPQDEEIQKRSYSFDHLAVSKKGPNGGAGWDIDLSNQDRKDLLDPKSPETCIEYGVINPGMKVRQAAEPLLPNTPYEVFIRVSEAPAPRYRHERKFLSNFCISHNEKGEAVLVEADFDKAWYCLKPGETRKRGFWGWLFGK